MLPYRFVSFLSLVISYIALSTALSSNSHKPPVDPAVLLLGPSKPGTATIRTALQTLGYFSTTLPDVSPSSSSAEQPRSTLTRSDGTFTELGCTEGYVNLASRYPTTRFILPLDRALATCLNDTGPSPCSLDFRKDAVQNSCQGLDQEGCRAYMLNLRAISQELDQENRLLKWTFDREPELDDGEKWVKLCRFLGLGYSVVERKRLRAFPQSGAVGLTGSLFGQAAERIRGSLNLTR